MGGREERKGGGGKASSLVPCGRNSLEWTGGGVLVPRLPLVEARTEQDRTPEMGGKPICLVSGENSKVGGANIILLPVVKGLSQPSAGSL